MTLTDGYHAVPDDRIVSVVTSLQMMARPAPRAAPGGAGLSLRREASMDLAAYRALFRKVGAPWLWFSRLRMADAALTAILTDPDVEVWVVHADGEDVGLLELSFKDGDCELAFFGLAEAAIGRGAGRWLMEQALERAFARPIGRFWLHTCTLDHPAAMEFYRRSGFVPYKRQVEVAPDPRALGVLPADLRPDVPKLGG